MDRETAQIGITRRQFLIGQAALLPWLAIGWTWQRDSGPSTLATAQPALPGSTQRLYSADLRHLYPPAEAGHTYAGSAPVAEPEAALERLAKYHTHLAEWLSEHRADIEAAIRAPEIVYRQLPYRSSVGHYLQMYAIPHPRNRDRYVAVTLSLASLPGERGSTYHKLVRAFPARFDYFWSQDAHGEWRLKERWMRTE